VLRTSSDSDTDRATAVMRGLVLAIGAVTFGLFAWVTVSRFLYPVDGEWMVGGVRDAVLRVRDGEPLYAAPSARFIPFVYPPLYHWTCAVVARFCSAFVACKLVSLASTAVLAWAIWRVARGFGATRFWAATGVLLHFGAYAMTLMFYDLERVDAFAAAVVALALVLLVTGTDRARTVCAGVLLGLAFFAKQPHVLAFGAAVVALYLAGEKRRALTVLAVGGLVFAGVFGYLEVTTHGWFRYYCVKLPGTHGIEPKVISVFFVTDVPRGFAIAAASVALGVPLVSSLLARRRVPEGASANEVLFAAIVLTTMAEAFFLRAHRGGWSNVIIAWTPFGCMAASVVASRLEEQVRSRAMSRVLLAAVFLQLLGGVFDPNEAAPNADDLAERQRLVTLVRDLEKQGEVLVTTASDITTPPHFQMAALFDILRAGDPLPEDLALGLGSRKYAAILVGGPEEFSCDLPRCDAAFATLASNYFVAARREERERNGMSGFDARPRWVMRPRRSPLGPMSKEALTQRVHVEMGLAQAGMMRRPPATNPFLDDTIEERAALP
jgi:Dolichyl-phosphate-mannose-protein mannosyltransferase